MNRLVGKKAVIVGEDPITLGIAQRYRDEGAQVTLLGDADRAAIASAAGEKLDILVLGGADIPEEKDWVPVTKLSIEILRAAQDKLVIGALTALQACEPALRAGGNSSVIFLFSPAGFYSEGGWSDYTISYHARQGLMRAVAAEWGPIRANMLIPYADTPGFRAFRARNPDEVDFRVSVTGMQRIGDVVKDIGGAAVFLGSADTQYLTGMMVHADGGASMTIPTVETQMPRS